ncbi:MULTISPECIES: WYL domain-containing protein [unclassified Streptomyces]|uniref:WYL domain-containing protein n=1 Tax=unclassified Streptomyces TaxID=2593676 RepID=UPI0033C9048E
MLVRQVHRCTRFTRLTRLTRLTRRRSLRVRPVGRDRQPRHPEHRGGRRHSGGDQLTVLARVLRARRDELVGTALAVRAEGLDADGRLRLEVVFQDARHAEWALWQLGPEAEVLTPRSLRTTLHDHAAAVAARYGDPSS